MNPIFAVLVRKEILDRLSTKRYLALFCAASGVILLSFITSASDYQTRMADHRSSVAAAGTTTALHAPSPLSALARGADEDMDRRFDVDVSLGLIETSGRPYQANRIFQVLPALDVLFIVRVLLSLMAVLLVYDAISGEKESGRLALLLSYPISRTQLFVGKWVANQVLLAAAVGPALLLGALWMTTVGRVPLDGETVPRLVGFFALAWMYVSLFLALGMAVSALAFRPATSSIAGLMIWTQLVFLFPSLTAQWASGHVPLPLAERMQAANTQTWIAGVWDRLQAERGGAQAEGSISRDVLHARGVLDRDYFARAARRASLHRTVELFSPAGCWVYGATAIAGTGTRAWLRFRGDLLSYRATISEADPTERSGLLFQGAGGSSWSWAKEASPPFLSLGAGTGLLLVLGCWIFSRYDAR